MASDALGLIRNTLSYASGRLIAKLLLVGANLYVARSLGPRLLGYWGLLLLVMYFSTNLLGGVVEALTRQVPFWRGQNRRDLQEEMQNTVWTYVTVWSTGLALGLFLWRASGVALPQAPELQKALWVFPLVVFIHLLYTFAQALLSAHQAFTLLSKGIALFALLQASFTVTALALAPGVWAVAALLAAFFAVYVLVAGYYAANAGMRLRFAFSREALAVALKIGFPIMLANLMLLAIKSVDKIFIAKMLGATHLGYYEIAAALREVLTYVPLVMGAVLLPDLSERHAAEQPVERLVRRFNAAVELNAFSLPFVIGSVCVLAPVFLKALLPQFLPAVEAIQILVAATFFLASTYIPVSLIISMNEQKTLVLLQGISLIVGGGLCYGLLRNGGGIAAAGLGAAGGYAVYSLSTFLLAQSKLNQPLARALGRWLWCGLPFAYAAGALYGLSLVMKDRPPELEWIAFAVLYSPFLWLLDRRTSILNLLWQAVTKRVNAAAGPS